MERPVIGVRSLGFNRPNGYMQLKPEDIDLLGIAPMLLARDLVAQFIKRHASDAQAVVWGANAQPGGGLNVSILKPTTIWRAGDGLHFEDFNLMPLPVAITLPHTNLPRIDRIYGVLHEAEHAGDDERMLRELPNVPGAQQGTVTTWTRERNTIEIAYLAGSPNATPGPPDLPEGAVPLYMVLVAPNAILIEAQHILDERYNFWSLEEVYLRLLELIDQVNNIKQIELPLPADDVVIGPGNIYDGFTEQEAWNDITKKINPPPPPPGQQQLIAFRPELLPFDGNELPIDAQSGRLRATGEMDENGHPCVQFPWPRQILIDGVVRNIEAENFLDQALTARRLNTHAQAATETVKIDTPLSLATVEITETSSTGTYVDDGTVLPYYVSHGNTGGRQVTPRNDHIIDMVGVGDFAGAPGGIWIEYNTTTKVAQSRQMTGDVPFYGIQFACTLGNNKILMCGPGHTAVAAGKGRLKWFLLNTPDGVVTAINGGPGDVEQDPENTLGYSEVMGDLIIGGANGIILMMIRTTATLTLTNDGVAMYAYHINDGSFELVPSNGTRPTWSGRYPPVFQNVDCCMFQPGEMMMIDGMTGPGSSYVYNYGAKSWRQLKVQHPIISANPYVTGYYWGPTISNVNGRIHFMSSTTTVWEFIPSLTGGGLWSQIRVAGLEQDGNTTRWGAGMCGLLKDGLPQGNGFAFGGGANISGPLNPPIRGGGPGSFQVSTLKQIWRFTAGGIVAGACGEGGAQSVTLAPATTSATIHVPNTLAGAIGFQVSQYGLSIVGSWKPGQVRATVSFNDDVTKVSFDLPSSGLTVLASAVNPIRHLWLTLQGTANDKPCISVIHESFVKQGSSAGGQWVIRYNPPLGAGDQFLYIDKAGKLRNSSVAQKTKVDEAVLVRATPNGGGSPFTVFNFINKKFIHINIRATKPVGGQIAPDNPVPVDATYTYAELIQTTGVKKDYALPDVLFNQKIVTHGQANLTGAADNEIVVIIIEAS